MRLTPAVPAILRNRRFWLFFVLPNAGYWLIASLTTALQLLPIMSLLVFAVAVSVCLAFLPGIFGLFRREGPFGTSEALTLGIWLSWFATAAFGLFSFVWRIAGQPLWMINNDVIGYFRFFVLYAGVLHMASPNAVTDRIPTMRWIKIGLAAGLAIIVFAVISYYLGLYDDLHAVANSE